jgi:hypothetical protein
MLPPFVPPSVRSPDENLPQITEFVIDRVEHSFDNSFDISGVGDGGVAVLPSIDEFVLVRTAEPASTAGEPRMGEEGYVPTSDVVAAHVPDAEQLLGAHRVAPSGSQDAIVNEVVEPAEAWEASAASTSIETEAAGPESSADLEPSQAAPEVWVTEERDAFDWHSAASLAAPPADVKRAAEEWSATEWERSTGSLQEHIATLLSQVSRRVRSGELEVHGSKQMGNEAALVAVLASLLAESRK